MPNLAQIHPQRASGEMGEIYQKIFLIIYLYIPFLVDTLGGSVAEWLTCWTQAQKGPGSNRSCDAVG